MYAVSKVFFNDSWIRAEEPKNGFHFRIATFFVWVFSNFISRLRKYCDQVSGKLNMIINRELTVRSSISIPS